VDYRILTLGDKDQWNEYLKELPLNQQDVYYTPEYYSLYQNIGDGQAKCFYFENDGNLAIYPFLVNSVNDLGYDLDKHYYDIQGAYGYNGVIASTNNEEFRKAFFLLFNEYCRDTNIVAEFTRFHPLLNNNLFSDKYTDVIFDRKTIYLDLNKPLDEIFGNFQRTTRKQIRRGTGKHNIRIENGRSDCYINEIYAIYCESMDRVNSTGYLYFNENYFKKLLVSVPSLVFSAFIKDEMIASIICITGKQYMHGHLGGAKMNYLNLSPYSILYYEIIKYAYENNFKKVHFGGGNGPDPDDPLLKFKMHFSGTMSDFYIGKKIYDKYIYDKVVNQWFSRYPEKKDTYKNYLLKYRY